VVEFGAVLDGGVLAEIEHVHEGKRVAIGVTGLGEESVGAELRDGDGERAEVAGRDGVVPERGLTGLPQMVGTRFGELWG
jgi:hypothetical protein